MLIYIGVIATFESLLGYFQPSGQSTLVITTADEDGTRHDRVLARLQSNGQLFVAVNHWPRAWYGRALENPSVQVAVNGVTGAYMAVPVSDEEHDRVNREHSLGLVFRILTGFPPRYFLRLDPD
ncbi:MAG: hypothetical protein VYD22_03900 [Gemmatimonadota bacterium]|nr:hypothetical protein [Gemmatimonadota bacterium]